MNVHIFMNMLKHKKEVDPIFFFDYQVDEENRLKNVFWLDSLSRSYALFSDILLLNTTHTTKIYTIVFVPFTRLNHHRQLICFGAGLLRDEKVESFLWLFNNFLIAIGSKKPKIIIID